MDRGKVLVEHLGRNDRHRHQGAEGVQGGADDQGEAHAEGNAQRRVVDLLSGTGHLGQSAIRDEYQSDHGHYAGGAASEERVQVRAVKPTVSRLDQAVDEEPAQDGQYEHDQDQLHRGAGLGTDHIEEGEHGNEHQGGGPAVDVDHQHQVGAHTHQGERVLENQGEPGPESGHRAH